MSSDLSGVTTSTDVPDNASASADPIVTSATGLADGPTDMPTTSDTAATGVENSDAGPTASEKSHKHKWSSGAMWGKFVDFDGGKGGREGREGSEGMSGTDTGASETGTAVETSTAAVTDV